MHCCNQSAEVLSVIYICLVTCGEFNTEHTEKQATLIIPGFILYFPPEIRYTLNYYMIQANHFSVLFKRRYAYVPFMGKRMERQQNGP